MAQSEENTLEPIGGTPVQKNPGVRRGRRWRVFAVAVPIAIILFLGVLPWQAYRDCSCICENTGSQKGHRQWCIGLRTRQWYRESRLEQFMRQEHPSELTYQWIKYEDVGKNIVGHSCSFRCGLPRVGTVIMHQPWFNSHVDALDDTEKLALYRVLASGDSDAIRAEEERIEHTVLAQAEDGVFN